MGDEAEVSIRSCEGCTACCYTHAVGEIQKWEFSTCASCNETGCGIYASRPRACGSYFCAWAVNDIGNDDERPDKVGVVCNTLFTRFTADDPPSILMLEAWPGALDEGPAQALLARILADGTSVRTGTRDGSPRWKYHVLKQTMETFGQMLEENNLKVVWHDI
ncbi:MAG: hypothetical protein AB202_01290 [Parcubacteria bacterium C7867-007]|nr:MAG: hypothetical protein AB202_01290 [Parcubacteria bacterium C7867-007]